MVAACVLALEAGLYTTATAALAQSTGHQGKKLQRMTQELNLTDAQQAQIKTILQTQKAKTQPLRQQLRQNRLAQSSTTTTGAFNEAQVRSFASKQAQIMTDLTVERERTKSQIFAVLTPDQRQKAQTLMQEHSQHRHHRKQMDSQSSAAPTPE